MRSMDAGDTGRRVVLVRDSRTGQIEEAPTYVDNDTNRQVYVVRRPDGSKQSPQGAYPRSSGQAFTPDRGYYNNNRGFDDDDDDDGCFACCAGSSDGKSAGTSNITLKVLNFLTKYICWTLTIALIVLAIAVICIVICGVFLGLYPSSNSGLKIAGIVIGALLAIGAVIFLFFALCCLGQNDGFFSYFGNRQRTGGGQAYALMPPPSSGQYTQPTGQVYAAGTRNAVYPSDGALSPQYVSVNGAPANRNVMVRMT